MKLLVLAITTVILLLGGVVTVALIQSTEAGSIITTRSNIKTGKAPPVKGNDNQVSTQDVIIKQYNNPENNCRDGAECSNSATFEIGGISSGAQTSEQAVSVESGDISTSIGDSNVFEASEPIPGVDIIVKKCCR